ncbi:MAG: tetratricopeptide repeat protein [Bacteroidales bacterium]|nr:tetratricopeptide repeat protein [Bacteroidales bacterium]
MKLLKCIFWAGVLCFVSSPDICAQKLSIFKKKKPALQSTYTKDTIWINEITRNATKLVRMDPDSNIVLLYSALTKSNETGYFKGTGDACLHLGTSYFFKFHYDSAEHYYNKAFEVYSSISDHRGMARSQHGLSYIYSVRSEINISLQHMLLSKKYHEEADDINGQYDCIGSLIYLYKNLNNNKEVERYMNELITLAQKLNDDKKLSNSYIQLGNHLMNQSHLRQAIEAYFKALGIAEKSNYPDGMADALGSIGLSYLYLQEFDNTISYYMKQEKILKELKKENELSNTYNSLGQAYLAIKKYDAGLDYFFKSLTLRKKMQYKPGISGSLHNIGFTYYLMEDSLDLALKYAYESLETDKEIENNAGIANNYMLLGKIFYLKKNLSRAMEFLEKSIAIANEYHETDVIHKTSGVLSKLYAETKSFEKAYNYYLLHNQIGDSLINRENLKRITQLEMQHEFDKKQNEISLEHLQDNLRYETQVKRSKLARNYSVLVGFIMVVFGLFIYYSFRKSQKANKEKEALLKEIHHRVKNNLQVISSLLNMQSGAIIDDGTKAVVKESQSRVKSMALIHQMLYQSEMFTCIDFTKYLEQLMSSLMGTYKQPGKNIRYLIHAGRVTLDIDTAIPLGLITNELATNALKYAFIDSAEGQIDFSISKTSERAYKFVISDNGKGLPENFDLNKSDTLGLKLVKILTRQIAGKIDLVSNAGTTVIISFEDDLKKV